MLRFNLFKFTFKHYILQISTMSVNHIFRQLTTGVCFNTKTFAGDAQRFGLVRPSSVKKEEEAENAVQLPSLEAVREEVSLGTTKNL
jgi:hypothetical protein